MKLSKKLQFQKVRDSKFAETQNPKGFPKLGRPKRGLPPNSAKASQSFKLKLKIGGVQFVQFGLGGLCAFQQ